MYIHTRLSISAGFLLADVYTILKQECDTEKQINQTPDKRCVMLPPSVKTSNNYKFWCFRSTRWQKNLFKCFFVQIRPGFASCRKWFFVQKQKLHGKERTACMSKAPLSVWVESEAQNQVNPDPFAPQLRCNKLLLWSLIFKIMFLKYSLSPKTLPPPQWPTWMIERMTSLPFIHIHI